MNSVFRNQIQCLLHEYFDKVKTCWGFLHEEDLELSRNLKCLEECAVLHTRSPWKAYELLQLLSFTSPVIEDKHQVIRRDTAVSHNRYTILRLGTLQGFFVKFSTDVFLNRLTATK